MDKEDQIINIVLQIEQYKENIISTKSFKSHLLETLYLIQQFQGNYKFIEILFTIFEFI